MDNRVYCRQHNLVPYDEFIADLWRQEFIFIGEEDHFSQKHVRNEGIILADLARAGSLRIATEDISDPAYRLKRRMLQRFNSSHLSYLPSDNRQMAEQLTQMNGKERNIAIVGSLHLAGPFSVDALVRRICPHRRSMAVFLEDQITPNGVYRKQTPGAKEYVVAGNL